MASNEIRIGVAAGLSIGIIAIGILITIVGVSGILANWIMGDIILSDIQKMKQIAGYKKMEKFSDVIINLEEQKAATSGLTAIGQILFFVGLPIAVIMIAISRFERKIIEADKKPNLLVFDISSNLAMVIFTALFAISMIFISSSTFLISIKDQTITLISTTALSNETNGDVIVNLLNDFLTTNIYQFVTSIFHAVYFGLVGFLFLIARMIQHVRGRKNMLATTLVMSGVFCLIIWTGVFVMLIGINPTPIPEINLPQFNKS